MPAVQKKTISLPPEQAGYIDDLVASGAYATASEVVRAGLRALKEREGAMERWLREEVLPAALATQADPARAIPLEAVFNQVRATHQERLRAKGRDA